MLFYRKKLSTANYGSAHCGAWGLIVYNYLCISLDLRTLRLSP